MSLNIQNAGIDACRELKGSPSWFALRAAIKELARQKMNEALDKTPEQLQKAIGYAAALRDVWLAFESATDGVPPNSPSMKAKMPGEPKGKNDV